MVILEQPSAFTKYPRFKCTWNSRDTGQHYEEKVWHAREEFEVRKNNTNAKPLDDPLRTLIPPLHIKLDYCSR